MKTILVFTRFSSSGFRQVMEGVRRLAESDGWNLRVIETGKSRRTPTEIVEAWRPDGCIVYCPQRGLTIPSAFHRRVPTVLVSPVVPPKERDVFWVRHDSTATGHRAATALLRLGLEHFAFVGWEISREWSRARCRGFCDELADIGLSCEVFRGTWRMDDPLTAQKALAAWLERLPRPLGLFAANDRVAEIVISACADAGLSVPDDVSIIGCDNDPEICETLRPTLTSLMPDFADAGFRAARLLEEALAGKRSRADVYGDIGIVVRQSTRRLRTQGHSVAKALEYIRLHAVEGIGVPDVVQVMDVSRRAAEQAFRSATGKSILEEINDIRLARAELLLRNPRQNIGAVAQLCGWKGDNFLKRLFKSRHGVSMRTWRDSHASAQ